MLQQLFNNLLQRVLGSNQPWDSRFSWIMLAVVLVTLSSGCSPDGTTEIEQGQDGGGEWQAKSTDESLEAVADEIDSPFQAPEPCANGQATLTTGYGNYPGLDCAAIADKVAGNLNQLGYRKGCQRESGADKRPKSVARVQVNECGPLPQGNGHYASMLVCCEVDSPAGTPTSEEVQTVGYDVQLDCAPEQTRALATDLHYPDTSCGQAAEDASTSLSSTHYKRACGKASPSGDEHQQILDAAVFTCRQDHGAVVDVALCCSALRPSGATEQTFEVPGDIWELLRRNDLLGIQLLLSRYPERANERGEGEITPLHRATSLAVVNALLAKRADPQATDSEGFTPLHNGVLGRQQKVVERLLQVGAAVDAATVYGDTPLSFAPNGDIARLLLDRGAQLDGVGGAGPLHAAAFSGRDQVIALLLEREASVELLDENGETPLHRAAFQGRVEAVRMLIEKGAPINAVSHAGRTPLDMANNEQVRSLLRANGGTAGRR